MKRILIAVLLYAMSAAAQNAAAPNREKVAGPDPAKTIPAPVRLDNELKGFQDRIARVGDNMYVSGQPSQDAIRELKSRGVTTIVNLRTPEEMAKIGFDEAEVAKSLGIKYVYLPVRGNEKFPYSPDTLTRFAAAMKEADGAVLLHCTVGWRASHLWTAYLVKERAVPVDKAIASGEAINLMGHHVDGRQPVEDFLGKDLPELHRK